ncbi:MAG: putative transport system permease protein [Mycobacteriales bacterium]
MNAVVQAGWGAVRRRRLQSLVIGAVVLLSSGTAVLALGLLVASSAPFDRAFSRQVGAHATASFDAAKVTAAELATTTGRRGVTAASGPYETVPAQLTAGTARLPSGLIAGRDTADSTVDKLHLSDGSWLTGPGQIVLSRASLPGGKFAPRVGSTVTVDVAGQPTLKLVGIADSITGSADAWVWPTQTDVLHATGTVLSRQMLYRFASADGDAAIKASLAAATAGLPAGALTGSSTYLAAQLRSAANIKPMVPFVVAFSVLGLAMSVLIVVNVVAGAVVAGFRTIGVQKALGFTPAQVVAVYAGQILAVCVPACLLGVMVGWLAAKPLLAQTAEGYNVPGATAVPGWTLLAVLAGVPLIVGLAALGPAVRGGRLSAVQAITVGRAPRTGRGVRLRRALAGTRLPRPVSFGLGTPVARPGRAAVTLVAVLFGATTVVFAIGLTASLTRVVAAFDRTSAMPVTVSFAHLSGPGAGGPGAGGPGNGGGPASGPAGPPPGATSDPAAVRAAIEAQPGTARVVGTTEVDVGLAGSTEPLNVRAYDGDASWTGYPMLSGRWYSGSDEAVGSSRMLRLTGTKVGDYVTIATKLGQRRIRIVGEVFANGTGATVVMSTAGLTGLVQSVTPDRFEVGLTAGTDPHAYVEAAGTALSSVSAIPEVTADTQENETVAIMLGLIATLTLLLSAVAALGVFNTVVLNTRERVHEIGVLKSIGMTPRQVRLMVVTSMVAVGVLAGALAVPAGWALHRSILPAMGRAAGTELPHSILTVYRPVELVALGLCGVALAVLGALVPAGWAARTSAATALRAE